MAEIKKINVNGVEYDIASAGGGSSGGSKLYEHSLSLIGLYNDVIINSNPEPITLEVYHKLLLDNGYDQNNPRYLYHYNSGISLNNSTEYYELKVPTKKRLVVSTSKITCYSATDIIRFNNDGTRSSTTMTTEKVINSITDTVVEL